MKTLRPLKFLGLLPAALLLTLLAEDSTTLPAPTPTGAPFQIVATGFEQPTGVVVHPQGFLVVTDHEPGVLYRLTPGFTADGNPAFTSEVLFSGLEEPIGVAVDRDENLLVAESDQGRVVRFGKLGEAVFSAVPEPVATGLRAPRWLAVDGAGTIYLSAAGIGRGQAATGTPRPRDELLLRIPPEGVLAVVADGFKELSGLALDQAGQLWAGATRRRGEREPAAGGIFKIRLSDGQVSRVVTRGVTGPQDLEVDGLGALYVTAQEYSAGRELDDDDQEDEDDNEPSRSDKGVILKATFNPDGSLQGLTPLAGGLGDPAGVAFDNDGNLYVAERKHGRVFRFPAPTPPVLDQSLPRYTNHLTEQVRGTAEPNALITVLGGAGPAKGLATDAGAFAIEVSLTPNTEQMLRVFATAARGERLTSRATETIITHDDIPPDTETLSGPSGELTSTTATFTFTATEAGSTFLCQLDGGEFAACPSPKSYTGLTAGLHTFRVKAQDPAGNEDPSPDERTFTVSALSIQITSPAAGATVSADSLLVRGTVEAGGAEVGVTVNGVVAAVSKGEFATFVPLEGGPNTITARLVDAAGLTASDAVTITVTALQEAPLRLLATPAKGLSPLTVRLEPSSLLKRSIVRFELDFEGDGVVDLVAATLERVFHVYNQERLFVPTLTVIDDLGHRTSAATFVNVFVLPDLVAKWNRLKVALRGGDIEGALRFIAEESRERYRGIFTALSADLPQIDSILTDIQPIAVRNDEAEFEMLRVSADGVERSFYILFIQDNDGIWRLRTF